MSIDYSKYEGHTEGPFEYDEPSGMVRNDSMTFADVRGWGHLSRKHGDVRALEIQRANGRLIADAPLLLKRCRELEAELHEAKRFQQCVAVATENGTCLAFRDADGFRQWMAKKCESHGLVMAWVDGVRFQEPTE